MFIFSYLLNSRGNIVSRDEQLLLSIVMTAIFIVMIYGGYFLLTYFLMKEQRQKCRFLLFFVRKDTLQGIFLV